MQGFIKAAVTSAVSIKSNCKILQKSLITQQPAQWMTEDDLELISFLQHGCIYGKFDSQASFRRGKIWSEEYSLCSPTYMYTLYTLALEKSYNGFLLIEK